MDNQPVATRLLRGFLLLAILICNADSAFSRDGKFSKKLWEEYINESNAAYSAGEYGNAIVLSEKALALNPEGKKRIETLSYLIRALDSTGQYQEAVTYGLEIIDVAKSTGLIGNDHFLRFYNSLGALLEREAWSEGLAQISERARQAGIADPVWMMDADLTIHQLPAGAKLPKKVGDFQRRGINLINRGWDDFATQYYVLEDDNQYITVYVTKAPFSAAQHFQVAKMAIDAKMAAEVGRKPVETVEENTSYRVPGRFDLQGPYGRYRLVSQRMEVETELLIFVVGDWHYKLRASYPKINADVGRKRVQAFIDSFPWPAPDTGVLAEPFSKNEIVEVCAPEAGKTGSTHGQIALDVNNGAVLSIFIAPSIKKPVSPKTSAENFCVKERFRANGKSVVAYMAPNGAGENNIYYHFDIDGDGNFIQFSSSPVITEVMTAIMTKDKEITIKGKIVHVNYHQHDGKAAAIGVYDVNEAMPYSTAKDIVVSQLRSNFSSVSIMVGLGDKKP